MFAVVVLTHISMNGIDRPLRLVVEIAAGAMTVVATARWRSPEVVAELKRLRAGMTG